MIQEPLFLLSLSSFLDYQGDKWTFYEASANDDERLNGHGGRRNSCERLIQDSFLLLFSSAPHGGDFSYDFLSFCGLSPNTCVPFSASFS
ncbi:hypothetical protein CSUI_007551, partial [Cystoisospora suis]